MRQLSATEAPPRNASRKTLSAGALAVMLPHTINGHTLIEADFEQRVVLVQRYDRRYRIRWSKSGKCMRDDARKGGIKDQAIDSDSYNWASSPVQGPVRVAYLPQYLTVDLDTLARRVNSLVKITGKSVDVDGLLTVSLHPDRVTFHTHGFETAGAAVVTSDRDPGHDDFGTVVVLVGHLLQTLKDSKGPLVELRVVNGWLLVGPKRVWSTTCSAAKPRASEDTQVLGTLTTTAISRAWRFAFPSADRPALAYVRIDTRNGETRVQATDGHRIYSEVLNAEHWPIPVDLPPMLSIPRAVANAVAPKQGNVVEVSWDETTTTVGDDELSFACARDVHPGPAIDNLLNCFGGSRHVELLPATFHALKKALKARAKDSNVDLQFGDKGTAQLSDGFGAVFVKGGEDVRTGSTIYRLNVKYLSEALNVVIDKRDNDSRVVVSYKQELDPLRFQSGLRTAIVMPTRR
jgi:hypothetical protein